jgi:hypothetical protein
MIDSIRAEIDYRQQQVRSDVAAGRRGTATDRAERSARTTEERPASGRPAGRPATGVTAAVVAGPATRRAARHHRAARPPVLRAQSQSGGSVC